MARFVFKSRFTQAWTAFKPTPSFTILKQTVPKECEFTVTVSSRMTGEQAWRLASVFNGTRQRILPSVGP